MTFNAASRLRLVEDRSAALGSSRCELPGMHSVPKSAVLPYASGVGGLSRRLLNIYIYIYVCTFLEGGHVGFLSSTVPSLAPGPRRYQIMFKQSLGFQVQQERPGTQFVHGYQ